MPKCFCGNEMTRKDWKHQWVCHKCGRTKPLYESMTNADRIRSMSDEELAEFFLKVSIVYAESCMTGESDCVWEDYPTHDKGCKDCFLEWLESEAGCEQ